MKPNKAFDETKYHEEYFINGKYIGGVTLDDSCIDEQRGSGYYSRRTFVLNKNVEVRKGHKKITINSGTEVMSEIILLCLKANKKALVTLPTNKYANR